ncbi:MAG: response regulator [Opitutae bacterium]|nr:response regulator [Opitutae bacterium]
MATSVFPAETLQPFPSDDSGKCVMLVDDEVAYIDLLEQLLTQHLACPVHSFTNPTEALRALPGLDVGLIVTDYQMPDLDGLQFVAAAQRLRPGVPAVMITAYQTNFTDEQLARVPTLKIVVKKPFKWSTLAAHIAWHWSGSTPPFPTNGDAP